MNSVDDFSQSAAEAKQQPINLVNQSGGFYQFSENLPVASFALEITADGQLKFVFLSQRFASLLAIKPEALQLNPALVLQVLHPDDYQDFIALIRLVARKQLPLHWQGRVVIKSQLRWYLLEAHPHVSELGQWWEGVLMDVTHQEIAQQNLLANTEKLQKIIQYLPIPMLSLALDTQQAYTLQINQQFIHSFGYQPNDVPNLSQLALQAFPDPQQRADNFMWWDTLLIKASIDSKHTESKQFLMACKDGSIKEVEMRASLVDEILIVSFIDNTERNQAQRDLLAVQQAIADNAIARSKSDERERIMQDLHDGFGSQLMSAQLRLKQGDLSNQALAELLEQSIADLYLVTDSFKDESLSLQSAFIDFRYRCQNRLQVPNLVLDWQLALEQVTALPAQQILQVLRITQEALNNALKHAYASRISIKAGLDDQQSLQISVADNGCGFPEKLVAGRGLGNMQCRARQLGASLQIIHRNPGIEVSLSMPLPDQFG